MIKTARGPANPTSMLATAPEISGPFAAGPSSARDVSRPHSATVQPRLAALQRPRRAPLPRVPRSRALALFVTLLVAAVFVAAPRASYAAGDYDTRSDEWNGLQEFVRIAQRAEVDLRPSRTLDWDGVRRGDGLIILYPQASVELQDISNFIEDGGRLAIFDDHGDSGPLLRWFQVSRSDRAEGDERVQGMTGMLTAYRRMDHSLCEGVDSLVTNEPVTLFHAGLQPVFSLSPDPRSGIVLVGQVGRGRLVVGGDPSVLINTMMRFSGNRQFSHNLLVFLAGEPRGRVHLVHGAFETTGTFAGRARRGPVPEAIRSVDQGIAHLQQLFSGPLGARFTALAMAVFVLLYFGARVWGPRPSDRFGPAGPTGTTASVADKVGVFSLRRANMLYPALVAKRYFERRLLRIVGLRPPTDVTAVLDRVRGRLSSEDARALKSLLGELDRLATPREEGGPTSMRAGTFLSLWNQIGAILRRLEAHTE